MIAAGPLVYAPTNEAGVMVLFGAVAREQGFAITRVQQAFPDCEAMHEIEPERWVAEKDGVGVGKQEFSDAWASGGRMRHDCVLET